jgi:medium-chain acyl-[acyl-carrier-protein] hydrolase
MSDLERWFPYASGSAGTGGTRGGDTCDPDGVRLYCIPHAMASASAFRSWVGGMPGVAVRPVQLPGREGRLSERPYQQMPELVADLAAAVLADLADAVDVAPRPFAVYGHSLGALIGFELVREIRRIGGPEPVHLLVSGCGAAELCAAEELPAVQEMTSGQIVDLLRRLGGTPTWVLDNPLLLAMTLPLFRADFTLKENYRYVPQPPLTVPLTAFAASGDPRVPVEGVAAWESHTSAGFHLRTLTGGHFAALEQPDTFVAELRTFFRLIR